MSAIDELRERLVAVEERIDELAINAAATRAMAAMADRDVAKFRPAMSGHTRALNALRETQIEQGRTLAEHTRLLDEHGRKLDEQGRVLEEHGRKLDEQGRVLEEHGRKLDEHSRMLTAIVRHLGVTVEDGEQPPDR